MLFLFGVYFEPPLYVH